MVWPVWNSGESEDRYVQLRVCQKWCFKGDGRRLAHVERTPPMLPTITMYPPATAATAGLPALFMPQLRNPLLAAKHAMAFKNTAAYFASSFVENRRMAKPMIDNGREPTINMPFTRLE